MLLSMLFNLLLANIKIIRKGNKNEEQEKALKNLNLLFNERNDAINSIKDYGLMILEARRKAAEEIKKQDETGLKILTLKQLFQN